MNDHRIIKQPAIDQHPDETDTEYRRRLQRSLEVDEPTCSACGERHAPRADGLCPGDAPPLDRDMVVAEDPAIAGLAKYRRGARR